MRRRPFIALIALISITIACSTAESVDDPSGSVEPTVIDLLPEESMAEVLEFIEVSIRVGGTDEGELLALGVDRSSLAGLPLAAESSALAWCTGPIADPTLDEVVGPGYLVRVEPEAVTVATGDIERFELRVEDVRSGDDVRATTTMPGGGTGRDTDVDNDVDDDVDDEDGATDDGVAIVFVTSFVIETGANALYVLDGSVTFGESPNGAVFSGVTATGIEIEGAFLCG